MKQSDLKHWTWDESARAYGLGATLKAWLSEGGGAHTILSFGGVTCRLLLAGELTEAALIAAHYEKTKQFAPDAEEPTRKQIEAWLSNACWLQRYEGHVEGLFWAPGKPAALLDLGQTERELHYAIEAIALITQRKREDIVREMVGL